MVHFFARGWGLMMMAFLVFRADQSLKDCSGSRVSGGDNRSNQADGLSDLLDAVSLVLFDHAAGLGILICIVDILCSIVVLDDLIFHYAHAGLFYSHLSQRDTLLVGCHCCLIENLVHLLLSKCGKYLSAPRALLSSSLQELLHCQ